METFLGICERSPNLCIASFIGSGINGNHHEGLLRGQALLGSLLLSEVELMETPNPSASEDNSFKNIASFIGSGINGNMRNPRRIVASMRGRNRFFYRKWN